MKGRPEFRVFEARATAGGEPGGPRSFDGYAGVFSVPGDGLDGLSEDLYGFRERVAPTFFDRAISGECDVRQLINHDPNLLLARSTSGTLVLSKDKTGLRTFVPELPDTSYARDLIVVMDRGDLNQQSFGFRCLADDWGWEEIGDEKIRVRSLVDGDIFDTSAVTFPAYPQSVAELNSYRFLHGLSVWQDYKDKRHARIAVPKGISEKRADIPSIYNLTAAYQCLEDFIDDESAQAGDTDNAAEMAKAQQAMSIIDELLAGEAVEPNPVVMFDDWGWWSTAPEEVREKLAKIGVKPPAKRANGGFEPETYAPEADELVSCPECGAGNEPDSRYCDQCGLQLEGRDDISVGDQNPVAEQNEPGEDPNLLSPAQNRGKRAGYQPSPYLQEADETVKCPNCGKMNEADAKYCDQCGTKLEGNPDVEVQDKGGRAEAGVNGLKLGELRHAFGLESEQEFSEFRDLLGAVLDELVAETRGALPYKETPTAPYDQAWDADAAWNQAKDEDDYRAMCAWVDPDADETTKGAYKLPHHEGSGDHSVVFQGVSAAIGSLNGSRGGASIPAGDRQAVYNHLAKHYKQFPDAPDVPELKSMRQFLIEFLEQRERREGKVLSAKNRDLVDNAIMALQALVAAAEPAAEALESNSIRRRHAQRRQKLLDGLTQV